MLACYRQRAPAALRPTRLLVRRGLSVHSHPPDDTTDPAAYCRDLVRKHDYEGFLVGQLQPAHAQDGYYALKAFSVELATVQDQVSSALIGQMRMQFWRDAVKGIAAGTPPRHPIALALHAASQTVALPAYHFKRIIDARDAELHAPAHLTVDALTAHAEATAATALYLHLALLRLPAADLAHAASHLGAAATCATLLRALPFHAAHGRMPLPAALTAAHGVRHEEVFRRGGGAAGLADAVYALATVAHDHVLTARDVFVAGRVPRAAMPVFVAGVPVTAFLQRLEAVDFDAFKPELQLKDWRLPWYIWRGFNQGKFWST